MENKKNVSTKSVNEKISSTPGSDNTPEPKKTVPGSALSYLDDFILRIKNHQQPPAVKTGLSDLDELLGGGLFPGLYVLGAISSLGKTTFLCQIADQIAATGKDVLIFSLEMSREELIAKNISRLSGIIALLKAIPEQDALSTRQILNGIDISECSKILTASFDIYKEIADHIYIYEGMGEMSVDTIRTEVENFITETGHTPIVIVDYIQIIAPYSTQYSTDKQNMDKTVLELKRLSRGKETSVIGISSLNRQNYREAINMSAFKESGGIEYSADVLIGLQLCGMGDKEFDVDEAKRRNPRDVELKILKNRNGPVSKTTRFLYYPEFNLFREAPDPLPFPSTLEASETVLTRLVSDYFSLPRA